MKRLFLSVLLVVVLAGCSGGTGTTEKLLRAKSLSVEESLAVSYFTEFHNGSAEDREAFLKSSIHPEVQSIFEMVATEEPLLEVKPIETAEDSGGTLVLLEASDGSEQIVFIREGKVGWVYNPKDAETFKEVRSKFN